MVNRFWSGLITLLLLSGCGWDGTATRSPEGLVPLTSIVIKGSQTIAAGTSTKFTADGFYLGVPVDISDKVAWSSASPTVANFKYATAPNKNRVTGNTPGTAVVTATLDGVSATYTLTVSNATIQAMTITPATASKAKGLTTQFEADGVFSDASNQNLTFDAVWSSDNIVVATVSNDPVNKGLAKGIAEGSAKITATFGGILTPPTAALTVTAAALQSITVTPANSSIVGLSKTVTYTAMGNYSDGTTADKTTASTWNSSVIGIATINASSGVATTVAVGTTVISATLNGIIGRTNLTVTTPALNTNGLQITPSNPFVPVNSTRQLTVTATFNDGSTQNVTSSCTWTTSSSAVSVDSTGVVTSGGSFGSSLITAAYGGQFISTTVTVSQ